MLKKIIFCFTLCCLSFYIKAQPGKPVPIIFDSDMGPDYDDVGAIALLHALADSGYTKILATMASTKYEGVAAVLNIFNTYFNRPGTPVGVPKGNGLTLKDGQHWTDTLIANYPHSIKNNAEAKDAVALYRETLASQPDTSVTIVTIGFLTNLQNLLKSGADANSPLDGKSLVARKVKQLVCMAGKFPEGYEFNVDEDIPASQEVFEKWPTDIVFSGFEIGEKIMTGRALVNNDAIRNSPVKDVFRICMRLSKEDSAGRKSWDETAVLVAVKGNLPWYHLQYGHIILENDGKNTWQNAGHTQAFLTEATQPEVAEKYINHAVMHQPRK